MTAWQSQVSAEVERMTPEVIAFRRQLHRNPEPSGEEYQTSLLLYQELNDIGLDVRMGPEGRGVIADLHPVASQRNGSTNYPMLAFRGDIDALRIHDCKTADYRSKVDGIMHACGHDAHSAIVLGTAKLLKHLARQDALPWPVHVRFIFQPAEETCEGALDMIGAKALDGVSAILATHMEPGLPYGKVGFRKGPLTASCDAIHFDVQGTSGHGARPHEAHDPIAASAQLLNALYLSIPRLTESHEAVVLSIGQIHGGTSANVIPESVHLEGTLRTLQKQVRDETIAHIHRIAEGIATATQTQITFRLAIGTDAVVNDSTVIDLAKEACVEFAGHESIHEIQRPSMGGEDFAFYLRHVPGALLRLGCALPGRENPPLLHSSDFDIDERVLPFGVRLLAGSLIRAFEPNTRWQTELVGQRSDLGQSAPRSSTPPSGRTP